SYIVDDSLISGVHCKLYAVRSPSGSVIVSCQDLSRNGILWNGQRIRKVFIILMDGDTLQLPNSLTFTCIHMWKESKEKLTIFEPTPPSEPKYKACPGSIGSYIVTSQCLGAGSFATVHLAIDPQNHRQVACKSIRTKRAQEIEQVMKEVRILMTLKHPNINEIYNSQEDNKFMHILRDIARHIFLQLCTGGDLFTYISGPTGTGNPLCEAEAKYLTFQLLQALLYLHKRMLAHRDLKPENILLFSPGPYPRILIADFGLARPNAYQETLNVCGTVSYLPPEGILALDNKHLGYVGMPADCWSVGVILYVMLCGYHPFDNDIALEYSSRWLSQYVSNLTTEDESQDQERVLRDVLLKEQIVYGAVYFPPSPWEHMAQAKSLVEKLLRHDPQLRATAQSALTHGWISSELTDLEKLYEHRIARLNTGVEYYNTYVASSI
ncbi:kinase-like domain-containing protein, partial [Cyathus striatus]